MGYESRRCPGCQTAGSDILRLMSRLAWRTAAMAGVVAAMCVLAARPLFAQFTSYPRSSRNILEGNWQSCREADGRYSERVYDHVVNGVPKFEVHMGPRREFAIFNGVQDEHREHDSPENLLRPYRLEVEGNLATPRVEDSLAQPRVHRHARPAARAATARAGTCCSRRPAGPSLLTSSLIFRTARSLLPLSLFMRCTTRRHRTLATLLFALSLTGPVAWAQGRVQAPTAPATPTVAPAQTEPPKDALGRDTPRGTVLGFMSAARKGNDEVSPLYLDTNLKGQEAVELAHKLYVVLDSRLPARLNELSDRPEGVPDNPLKPDQNVVGTINTASGPFDVVVERVTRGKSAPVWLFSRQTLSFIPDAYDEVDLVSAGSVSSGHPGQAANRRHPAVRVAGALPGPAALLSRCWARSTGWPSRSSRLRSRRSGAPAGQANRQVPGLVRLVILGIAIRWILGSIELAASRAAVLVGHRGVAADRGPWLVSPAAQRLRRAVHSAAPRDTAARRLRSFDVARRIADVLVIWPAGWRRFAISASIRRPRSPGWASAASPSRSPPRRRSRTSSPACRSSSTRPCASGTFSSSATRSGPWTTSGSGRRASAPSIERCSACPTARLPASASKRCRHATSSGSIMSSACATGRRSDQMRAVIDGVRTLLLDACGRGIRARFGSDSSASAPFPSISRSLRTSSPPTGSVFSRSSRNCCSASWKPSTARGPQSPFPRRRSTSRGADSIERRSALEAGKPV